MSIEMDMCTVIGAACRFECVHGAGDWWWASKDWNMYDFAY